jgi:hypothetical protein
MSKRTKLNHDEKLLQKVPEDTRRHHATADLERLPSGTGQPHHGAARPPTMAPAC